MNDILPGEVEIWQELEQTARDVFSRYGYAEIRVPVVEKTELFCRSIGESTDIVEKEMYTFEDRSGNSLTLRPEGTASVMRSFIQHKLYNLDPVSKLYYLGPMFRYERPQKGRYRQFHQIGAEVIGVEDALVDVQVLAMLVHFFEEAEIEGVALQINSLGCPECRPAYRTALVAFLAQRTTELCSDCVRRTESNPLRVLDCKVPGCQEATLGAPSVLEHLCGACDAHFARVRSGLEQLELTFEVNPRMVRGHDHSTRTTFEMVTDRLGSQNAVAAGGRYDGLIRDLGGPPLPGIGFAMGLERLVLLKSDDERRADVPQVFFAALGEQAANVAFNLMSRLQRRGVWAEMDYFGKSLKAQMRRADKLAARKVVILGGDELERGVAMLRDMSDGSQSEVAIDDLLERLVTA